LDEKIISGCSLAGFKWKLDGCIVWNAHNTVLGEEALLLNGKLETLLLFLRKVIKVIHLIIDLSV